VTNAKVARSIADRQPGDLPSPTNMTVNVVVAVATYLRPDDLTRCLGSVLQARAQVVAKRPYHFVRVLVVDNDSAGSARDVVATLGGSETHYVIEPTPGISAARNRALADASGDDLLVFIDDDEEVGPNWLTHLLTTYEAWRPAAVAGRVVSAFPYEPEPWFHAGGFFRRRSLPTGSPIKVAATNNLLLDLSVVRELGLSFDEYYGLIGGSDHHFTRVLARHDHGMVWCDEAVAVDHVPATRLTRAWVLARARRTGNSEVIVDLRLTEGRLRRMQARLTWAGLGLFRIGAGATAVAVGRAAQSLCCEAKGVKALHRGRGMLMGALDRTVAEYQRPAFAESAVPPAAVRVLASFPEPRPTTNPYISQLAAALDRTPGVTLLRFSWRCALLGSYDVVHVHWPEVLLQSRTPWKTYGRRLLFAVLLVRWRLTGTPVVRTLHNPWPHERLGLVERLLFGGLDALTVRRIALNSTDAGVPDVDLVPHGHYRDTFADVPVPESVPGRVVFASLTRDYKNVPGLVRAFRDVRTSPASLHVIGSVADERLAEAIRAAAGGDERISTNLRFLTSGDLAREIGQAQLVALPYSQMHNSGAALLALSLGRPVLVPNDEVNRLLGDEVGAAWVCRYDGELTGPAIESALEVTGAQAEAGEPDLASRSWAETGEAHLRVYRAAARRPRD
jgi:hypothetical protein